VLEVKLLWPSTASAVAPLALLAVSSKRRMRLLVVSATHSRPAPSVARPGVGDRLGRSGEGGRADEYSRGRLASALGRGILWLALLLYAHRRHSRDPGGPMTWADHAKTHRWEALSPDWRAIAWRAPNGHDWEAAFGEGASVQ
jgi:hypothetical protein